MWNWHIDTVADHVQAVFEDWLARQNDSSYSQRIRNLLVNIPPGTAKSRIVSVYAPAWMWLQRPGWRCICISANPRVALRDATYCRELIESEWYQEWFRPTWKLIRRQNAKGYYWNSEGGSRLSLGITAKIVGDRGDAIIVDDPNDAEEVNSEVMRAGVNDRWESSFANRVNDPRSSVRIGIQQRFHEDDWSGHVLGTGEWEHLCLPQEFEPDRRTTTAIGWTDPRSLDGDLLFPDRYPPDVLASERRKGEYYYAGQHQQRPSPRGGGMFLVEKITIVDALPAGCKFIRYWDKAGTEGGEGARSAGVKMAKSPDGRYFVEHVRKGRWSAAQREGAIKQTAELDGKGVVVWTEQEPGSGGLESATNTVINLAGWSVYKERVTGDKETRARPLAAQVEVGNVYMLRDTESDRWNREFLDELKMFPNGKLKDQVDGASGAFNKLALTPVASPSVVGKPRPAYVPR